MGCAMGSAVCSICGADRRKAPCSHRPGERYEGKLCHIILEEPTDAYEWSFVAIPAQPGAGVTKGFGAESPALALEKAASLGEGVSLSAIEARELARWAGELQAAAEEGRELKEKALREAVRLGRLSLPRLERELLEKTLRPLAPGELERWCGELRRRAADRLPQPQTAPGRKGEGNRENESFLV